MVLVLSNDDVRDVLTMEGCMAALEDAYREEAAGRAVNQLRHDTRMPLPEREEREAHYEFKTMVGVFPKAGVAAIRLSSTLNHRPIRYGVERAERLYLAAGETTVGLIQLYSTVTGEPLAFLPDGVLQGMRVGGTYGLAAKYLGRGDACNMGLLGSGWQARYMVAAVAQARRLRRVRVYSPNPEHRARFAEEVGAEYGVEMQVVASADEAARDADILIAATNARAPLITGEHVRKGLHFAAVQTRELSDEAIRKADVIVVHAPKHFRIYEAGDGPYGHLVPQRPTGLEYDKLPLLEDVIAGKVSGRTRDDQITMFWGIPGLGIQFAAVGAHVYELAKQRGLGHEIPTEWFTQTLHT